MKVSTDQGERGIVMISRPRSHLKWAHLFVGLVMQFTSTRTHTLSLLFIVQTTYNFLFLLIRSKPKAAKTNGEIRDNTSDNKSKAGEDKPMKKKSAQTNRKTPTSAVTCAETKKGSGRYAVRVRFPGVGRRNVGTYQSLDEMAYAKGCASRKHRQLKTSDDAFATKEAAEEAIEAIRAYVKQALADRQKALDMQALIQKKREVKNLIVKTKSCPPSPPALERQDSRNNMKDILPTGIKLLPSGKYEVAIFFLVGERRIGVYDSLSAAVVANEAATTTLRSYLLKHSIMRGAIPGPSDSELALETAIAAAKAKVRRNMCMYHGMYLSRFSPNIFYFSTTRKVASLERRTAPTLPLKKRLLERNRQELSLPFKKRFIEESTGMPQTAAENVEQDKLLPLKKRLLRAVPVSDLAPATASDIVYLDGAGPNDDGVVGNSKDKIAYLDRIKPDKESEDTMIGGSIVPGGREFGVVGWQSFPARLMQTLSSSTCTKNIGADFVWSPDGLSFVCTDPGKHVTSAHSVQFFNDLYMFGFEQNPDGSYFHPLFQRDHPQLCLSISGAGRTSRGTSYRPFSENWPGANGIYYDVLIPRVDPMDDASWFGFNLQKLDRHGWPRILGNHGPWLRDGDIVVDVNGQPMYSTIQRFVGYRCALPGGLLMPTYIREASPFPLESVLHACRAAKTGHPLKLQIFRPNASHQASL